jgi:Ceramidase
MRRSSIPSGLPARSNLRWQLGVLGLVLLGSLAAALRLGPIEQSQAYHDFADHRTLLGVPNLLDVASNLAFLAVGACGVALCLGRRRPGAAASWTTVFIGTALVAVGSAYYHWAPSDATLLWDRLPMSLAFTALFIALLAEHVDQALDRLALAPALLIGVGSVLWWHWSGDLRLYLWVQFAPLLCIPVVLALFPATYTHRRFLVYALGVYLLAKLAEHADRDLFDLTGHVISGHTLKHLLAAGAIFGVLLMLRRRGRIAAP